MGDTGGNHYFLTRKFYHTYKKLSMMKTLDFISREKATFSGDPFPLYQLSLAIMEVTKMFPGGTARYRSKPCALPIWSPYL